MVNLKYYLIKIFTAFKSQTVNCEMVMHSLADKEFLHKSESSNAH